MFQGLVSCAGIFQHHPPTHTLGPWAAVTLPQEKATAAGSVIRKVMEIRAEFKNSPSIKGKEKK